jgi:hypothetical protein
MALRIWAIDCREHDHQEHGEIISTWQVHDDEPPSPRYADYCALYGVWGAFTDSPPNHVGFFGYRKYLVGPCMPFPDGTKPAHSNGWWECDEKGFDAFRKEYAQDDGKQFLPLLAQHDILVAPPFYVYAGIVDDFARSRSRLDAETLAEVLGSDYTGDHVYVFPYIFIARWSVFHRAMAEMEPLRRVLDEKITAADATDGAYAKRPMAYVMERVWSYWLARSGLSIHTLPLLHCWEKHP